MIKQFVGAVFLFAVFGNACVCGMNSLTTCPPPRDIVPAGECPVLFKSWRPHVPHTDPDVADLPCCGNSFSREAVLGMMKSGRTFACPMCRDTRCKPSRDTLDLFEIVIDLQKFDQVELEAGLQGGRARFREAQARHHLFTKLIQGLWGPALDSGERTAHGPVGTHERTDSCDKFTKTFYAGIACGAAGGCIAGISFSHGFLAVLEGMLWATGGVGVAMLPISAVYAFHSSRSNGGDADRAYDLLDLLAESEDEEELEVVVV